MTRSSSLTALWLALLPLPGAAQSAAADLAAGRSPPAIVSQDDWESTEPGQVDAPPPPPTSVTPPPPRVEPQAAAPSGQWVDTQQYGRIWIPYSDSYTYTPPSGHGEPYEYVYYPSYGWTWVVAPWIWGWGPWPVFGYYGPVHYGWYGHGWWRTPSRWHYAPAYRSGGYDHGGARGPYRAGYVGRIGAPPGYRSPGVAPRGFAAPGGRAPSQFGSGHPSGRPAPAGRASGRGR